MSATLFDPLPEDVALTGDEWYTPRWLFKAAGLIFDMDVCAPVDPAMRTCPAREYLTVVEDGLTAPWRRLVWCNPPYSNPGAWTRKFVEHGQGLALVQFVKRARWRTQLVAASDAITIVNVIFTNAVGKRYDSPMPILLAACGVECVSALARVAAADSYACGTYHVRPGLVVESTANIPKRQEGQ